MKISFVSGLIFVFCSAAQSADAQHAWDLLKQPDFKSAYLEALGSKVQEKWLTKLPGPSNEAVHKVIGGEEFLLLSSCKPHACDTDNIAIAYGKATKRVYAKLREESGTTVLIGAPSAGIKSELESYYEKQFSSR
ncbi:hypothetical protein LNV09_22800 [Paucibacter sp. B2R-40]|uniref:Ivy family c-type lysozyme inhibitor n=1 Tax=Paucibacter sp. B2R-40 TaxID=2893554 RepID=UPI0021E36D87|nr:Ivy family c-type lysozyme inhibitor [Paucibacter sp. B2R-40]MCV2356982.1 hypothetical protein [Paucibacter sp. B2R-40]